MNRLCRELTNTAEFTALALPPFYTEIVAKLWTAAFVHVAQQLNTKKTGTISRHTSYHD